MESSASMLSKTPSPDQKRSLLFSPSSFNKYSATSTNCLHGNVINDHGLYKGNVINDHGLCKDKCTTTVYLLSACWKFCTKAPRALIDSRIVALREDDGGSCSQVKSSPPALLYAAARAPISIPCGGEIWCG
jgi:hypothetical protein